MMILKTTRSHKASPGHRVSPMVLTVSSAAFRRPVSALALMALLWTATPATVMAQASEGDQSSQAPTRAELLEGSRRAKTDTVENTDTVVGRARRASLLHRQIPTRASPYYETRGPLGKLRIRFLQ